MPFTCRESHFPANEADIIPSQKWSSTYVILSEGSVIIFGIFTSGKGTDLTASPADEVFFRCPQATIMAANTANPMICSLLTIFSNFSLGNIDDEITYLLKFSDNVHIEHADLIIVVRILLDVDDMLLAESVAAFIDIVLGILGIGNVLQAGIGDFQVRRHCLERIVDDIAHASETLQLLFIERQAVLITACKNTSHSIAGVSDTFQLADNLVHTVDPLG